MYEFNIRVCLIGFGVLFAFKEIPGSLKSNDFNVFNYSELPPDFLLLQIEFYPLIVLRYMGINDNLI